MMRLQLLPSLLALLCLVAPAAAQEAPAAPKGPLDGVRGNATLSDEDRGTINKFVGDRITELLAAGAEGGSPETGRAALAALRSNYNGAEPFLQAYAAACLERIRSAYKKADPAPAAQLITLLDTLNTLAAQETLLEALQDDRVGVRAAAVVALRTLRPKLAQAGDAYGKALAALVQAGQQEKSRDTLRAVYGALHNPQTPAGDARADVGALVDLLAARAKLYQGDSVPALGADDAGLTLVSALASSLSDDQKKRITVATAEMMRYAIERYASGDRKLADVRDSVKSEELLDTRNAMERLVITGEKLLLTLLSPPKSPDVTGALRKVDAAAIRLAWSAWVEALQAAVGQDFTLQLLPETPASQPATPTTKKAP